MTQFNFSLMTWPKTLKLASISCFSILVSFGVPFAVVPLTDSPLVGVTSALFSFLFLSSFENMVLKDGYSLWLS